MRASATQLRRKGRSNRTTAPEDLVAVSLIMMDLCHRVAIKSALTPFHETGVAVNRTVCRISGEAAQHHLC
jgi:hypothetical protein